MSVERPFVYRTSDALQNLHLRMTVRQVRGGTRDGGDRIESPLVTHLTWQEKKFAPWELAKYSSFCEKHAEGDGGNPKDYIRRFRAESTGLRQKCVDDTKNHGVYIYTYIDGDHALSNHEQDARENSKEFGRKQNDCQVMHVMAAVISNNSEVDNAASDIFNGDHVAWRKLKVGDSRYDSALVQERVLCTIKSFPGGTVEVTPGFSEDEFESDDEGPFWSSRAGRVAAELGPRLTVFSFRSRDRTFQYTVENASGELDLTRVEEVVAAGSKPAFHGHPYIVEFTLPKRLGTLDGVIESAPTKQILHLRVELVSALGFFANDLYVEYQVLLPSGWLPESSLWHMTEQGEHTCHGSTQIATVEELPRVNAATLRTLECLVEHSAWAAASWTHLVAGVAVLLLGVFLGIDHIAWLCGVVVVCAARYGENPSSGDSLEPTAHFGIPIAFSVAPPRGSTADTLFGESPTLFFQASSVDWLGRHRVEGYGALGLPVHAGGSLDCETLAWRPCGTTTSSKLTDLFIGGAHRLKDLRFAAHPPRTEADTSHKRRFLSRFGFATETAGRVRIRAQAVEQDCFRSSRRSGADEIHTGLSPARELRRSRQTENLMQRSNGGDENYATPLPSLENLQGETTTEKAMTFIRELQARRARVHEEHSGFGAQAL